MSHKDEVEIEIKREMVCLLLNTSHFNFQKIDQVTEAADKLSCFIINGTQAQTACQPEIVIETIIQDLDSQGSLAHALEKWIIQNERFLSRWSSNRRT